TTAYGNTTGAQAMGSGVSELSFSDILTGFTPGVTYHFRAAAQNSVGIAYGADKTFLAQDSGIDITPTDVNGPPSAEMGVFINATATILNQGANAAGLFRVNLFLADDPQLNGWSVEIDRRPVESLLGGQSTVVNFNGPIPTGIAEGSYYLVVSADDDDRIIETDETNNLIADPITIYPTSLPDLAINGVTGPGSEKRGNTMTVSTTVLNQGGGSTGGPFNLDHYLSTDTFVSASDIYLGTETVSAMAGEESRVVDSTVTVPGGIAKGTYYLGAIADPGNVIIEASEGNNWGAGDTIRIK
ncbi:MAG TPA: CARDB domain-containing protein, partial [Nitrospiria bacterium]